MTEAAALAYAQRTTGTDATPHLDTARHPDLLLVSAASDQDKRKTHRDGKDTHSDGKHTHRGGKHVHGRRRGHQSSTAFPVDGTETLIDPAEVTTLSATSPSTTRAAGVAFPLSQPLPAEMQLPSHYPAIQALSIAPDKNRYSPIDQAFATADSVHAEWFRITDKGANAALATAKKNGADVLVVEDQKNMSGAAAQKA